MQNVLNTLRVLEEVATRQPVGVGELARVLGMPKSSTQRALHTLNTAGWIRQARGEVTRWVLTTRALDVGRHATEELSLRDAGMPVLEELRARTEETIHLMVPEGDKVVLIERLQTPKAVRIVLPLGINLPLHASANGKAVLAHMQPAYIDKLMRTPLPGYTHTTITSNERLQGELAAIRRRGYATNSGEWRSDVAAVAAAVLDSDGVPVASLSISTPRTRMPEELVPTYGRHVKAAALALAARLGYARE